MRIATGLLLSALVSGCASVPGSEPLPFLPLLAPRMDEIALTAAVTGRLVVERGCVKLAHGERTTTVIWERGTELARDASGLFLRETHSGRVVRFGVETQFGGGQQSESYTAQAYPEVARRCGPPYASGWIPAADRER